MSEINKKRKASSSPTDRPCAIRAPTSEFISPPPYPPTFNPTSNPITDLHDIPDNNKDTDDKDITAMDANKQLSTAMLATLGEGAGAVFQGMTPEQKLLFGRTIVAAKAQASMPQLSAGGGLLPQTPQDADKEIKELLENAAKASEIAKEIRAIAGGELLQAVGQASASPDPPVQPVNIVASGLERVAQGQVLLRQDFEAFKRKTTSDIADVRRQGTKYVLRFMGKALPPRTTPQEQLEDKLDELCREKWNVRLTQKEKDAREIRNIHFAYGAQRDILLVAVSSLTRGSWANRCLFRPNNWAGKAGMDLSVEKQVAPGEDRKAHDMLLWIRAADKKSGRSPARVVKVRVEESGVVSYTDGGGQKYRVLDAEQAFSIMEQQEKVLWLAREKKGQRMAASRGGVPVRGGPSSRGGGKSGGRGGKRSGGAGGSASAATGSNAMDIGS